MSESCNIFANKLNRKESSGQTCNKENESLLKTINIPKIATNTSVEPEMITGGNKNNTISVEPVMRTDDNNNNDNANIIAFDDIFNDKNLMNFVSQIIEQLEIRPTSFDEFVEFMKSRYDLFELNYSAFGENVNYEEAIEELFKMHSTMSVIQAKMQSKFPLTTQDVFTQDAIVIFVPENKYSSKFMIVGGRCNHNDNINTSLENEYQTTAIKLEKMKVNWKVETLISFDIHRKSLMNRFISWHMWIKEIYNDTLVMDYNELTHL